jgi:hypothetical protein
MKTILLLEGLQRGPTDFSANTNLMSPMRTGRESIGEKIRVKRLLDDCKKNYPTATVTISETGAPSGFQETIRQRPDGLVGRPTSRLRAALWKRCWNQYGG